ncbi:MAG: 50S ribosomal protein L35 [Clostridiales bacterium]|jgi:large subunit ribosomal protein L35|nr:50S ribosomal protein L35 [Clostridiales bacterium]MDD2571665.1 50S ribosomal protein L35 [Eubacteriales bacterium]MDY0119631.1 50S ribosomal protein L35 [Clostridia bacterium]NLG29780.1 50S ribosomal protein L35 [Clostridiaceae bacterium]MCK9349670.1 50S ribosomal protein L35 [Clostridiales bacterium]
MPKQKTHSSSKKRYKVTGTGKYLRSQAFTSHILTKKSPKRKRNLRKTTLVSPQDAKRLRRLLPYK